MPGLYDTSAARHSKAHVANETGLSLLARLNSIATAEPGLIDTALIDLSKTGVPDRGHSAAYLAIAALTSAHAPLDPELTPESGETYARLAMSFNPHDPIIWTVLGGLLATQLRTREAIATFRTSIRLVPDNFAGLTGLAAALLETGHDDVEAFAEMSTIADWLVSHDLWSPVSDAPIWRGEPLAGKSILVSNPLHNGHGDLVWMARYLPLLVQRGAQVHFTDAYGFAPLIGAIAGVQTYVSAADIPPHDLQTFPMVLPHLLGSETAATPPVCIGLSVRRPYQGGGVERAPPSGTPSRWPRVGQ